MKYAVYLILGGWMFFLGLMVGRDTLPFHFDTQQFQKRLMEIAREGEAVPEPQASRKKILPDLPALNSDSESSDTFFHKLKKRSQGVSPASQTVADSVKVILPNPALKTKTGTPKTPAAATPAKVEKPPVKPPAVGPAKGRFTIQVAAHNSAEAAAQEIKRLNAKGFVAGQWIKERDGVTWYRIRVGDFAQRDQAKAMQGKLKQAGIKNALIIKKE